MCLIQDLELYKQINKEIIDGAMYESYRKLTVDSSFWRIPQKKTLKMKCFERKKKYYHQFG
jgi:hypothetical protein